MTPNGRLSRCESSSASMRAARSDESKSIHAWFMDLSPFQPARICRVPRWRKVAPATIESASAKRVIGFHGAKAADLNFPEKYAQCVLPRAQEKSRRLA